MRLVLVETVLVLLVSINHACAKDIVKPNFIPYCTTRDKCKSACSCHVSENCSVLELDDVMRKNILNYHNQIRDIQSRGEPVAGGMTMLQYDEDLEQISRCWAARCEEEYSECFITPKFNETSQAAVQTTLQPGTEPKITLLMQMMNFWLGQAEVISAETLSDIPAGDEGEKIHNFAQLLSDRVQYVGCAWSRNDQLITFICSYGPRGPIPGEAIFKIGKVCSMCPENYACDNVRPFDRLCKEMRRTTPAPTPPSPPPMPPTPAATSPPLPPPKPPSTTSLPVTNPPQLPPFPAQPVIIPQPQPPPQLPTTVRTCPKEQPPLLLPQPPPFNSAPQPEPPRYPPPTLPQAAQPAPPTLPQAPATIPPVLPIAPAVAPPTMPQVPVAAPPAPPPQPQAPPPTLPQAPLLPPPKLPPYQPQQFQNYFPPSQPPQNRPVYPPVQSGPPPMLPQALDVGRPPLPPQLPIPEPSVPNQMFQRFQQGPPMIPQRSGLGGTYQNYQQPSRSSRDPSQPSSSRSSMREHLIGVPYNVLQFPHVNTQSQTYIPPRPPLPEPQHEQTPLPPFRFSPHQMQNVHQAPSPQLIGDPPALPPLPYSNHPFLMVTEPSPYIPEPPIDPESIPPSRPKMPNQYFPILRHG